MKFSSVEQLEALFRTHPYLSPIVIVGPTATGKTDVAVELARMMSSVASKQLTAEIVSADSVQVYRSLNIGSAKPDIDDRKGVPFHLLDLVSPDHHYSVADWKRDAIEAIGDTVLRGNRPIICGGTGMYVRALLDDWSLAATPADIGIREELTSQLDELGAPEMHSRLAAVDPSTAARLHPNDRVRIVRALEVLRITGKSISAFQAHDRDQSHKLPAIRIGLTLPRSELYDRINLRVDKMMERGFLEEVSTLLAAGYRPANSALGSLGYNELSRYLSLKATTLEATLETTIETIKLNTRRFAKRQITWFRADTNLHWMDISSLSTIDVAQKVAEYVLKLEERSNPDV